MSIFSMFFELGFDHILDTNGYDHILFVIALTVTFRSQDYKRIIAIISAFTVGHSVSLALGTLKFFSLPSQIVETCIVFSILITCLINIFYIPKKKKYVNLSYLIVSLFGLIHGMGFSTYLQALLGRNKNITLELFAFNLGLEIGQILIIIAVLIISYIFVSIFQVSQRDWQLATSSAIGGVVLTLLI